MPQAKDSDKTEGILPVILMSHRKNISVCWWVCNYHCYGAKQIKYQLIQPLAQLFSLALWSDYLQDRTLVSKSLRYTGILKYMSKIEENCRTDLAFACEIVLFFNHIWDTSFKTVLSSMKFNEYFGNTLFK